jgi:uncharacterized membrane protein YqjE
MAAENGDKPGLGRLVGSLARTGLGVLRNRGELLAVEWQEEKARQAKLLLCALAGLLLGFLGVILLTGIIIFLFPQEVRAYVAGVFALLYLAGAVWAGYTVKSLMECQPFGESLAQLKKDREWMESLD